MGRYKWNPDDDFRQRQIDDGPTTALPGTAAKIAVMQERVARDRNPHHPDDAKWDDATALAAWFGMLDFLTKEKQGPN